MSINLTGKADATIASAALQAGKAGVAKDLSTTFKVMSDSYATGMGKLGTGLAKVAEVAAKQGAKLAKKAIDEFKAPPVEDLEMMPENMSGTLLNDISELKDERKGMLKFWDKKDDPDTEIDEGRMSWKEYKKRKKEISDEVASFQANKTAIVEGINNGTFDTGASDNYNMLLAETFMSEDGVIAEGDHKGVYAKHVKMPDGKYAWKLYDKDDKEISGVNQDNGSLQYLDGSDVAVRFEERQAGELEDARKATQELQTDAYKDFDSTITKPDNVVAGVVNDDVRAMQNKLVAAGYDLPKFGVDGKFGPETEKAWNDYSSKLGLYNDLKAKAEGYTPGEDQEVREFPFPENFADLSYEEKTSEVMDLLRQKYGEDFINNWESYDTEWPTGMTKSEAGFLNMSRAGTNFKKEYTNSFKLYMDDMVKAGGTGDTTTVQGPGSLARQQGATADIPVREQKFVRSKDIANLLVPNAEGTLSAWQQLEIDVLTSAQEGGALREHELRNNLRKAVNTPEKMAYMVNQPIGNMEFSYKEQLSMPSRISAEMWTAINDIAGEELSALDTDGVPGLTEADFENNLENFKILREAMLNFDDPSAKEIFVEWYAQDITRSHGELFDSWVASQQGEEEEEEEEEEEIVLYGGSSAKDVFPGASYREGTAPTNADTRGAAFIFMDILNGDHVSNQFDYGKYDYVYDPNRDKWSREQEDPILDDKGKATGDYKKVTHTFKNNAELLSSQGLGWSGSKWLMDMLNKGVGSGGGGIPNTSNF